MESWGDMASQSPLAKADWGNYFQNQVPDTGWWSKIASPFQYGSSNSTAGSFDYDPGYSGEAYSPASGLTQDIINSDIDTFMSREYPELFDFNSGTSVGGVGNVGKVSKKPGFGQFAQTPGVDDEIQSAAEKYGVPANFLKSIIAKESSGAWSGGNLRPQHIPSHSPQLGLIHGYVGVFEGAARSRGFGDLWDRGVGNRAVQIELLAAVLRSQYDQIRKESTGYGWTNVSALHYSGDPSGRTNPAGWETHGTTRDYMARIEGWWKDLDADAGNTWSNFTSTGQGTGVGSPNNANWAGVNKWDDMVVASAQQYGVPANLVKAIMRAESGGDPNAGSPQGATGLMQVMPFHVNGNQAILYDPQTNIDVGVRILSDYYRQYGTWEMAARAYIGLGGEDALGTDNHEYWRDVKSFWDELNAEGSGMFGGPPRDGGSTSQVQAVWGGKDFPITQNHGPGAFSSTNPGGMYDYSYDLLGELGHPGIDVGMPEGTPIYSPVSGEVVIIGSGGFWDNKGGAGQIRVRMDNGHEVIFGHMRGANVTVGQRVNPGMQVGTSGIYGTGAHLHLEYRIPNDNNRGGWQAIDPMQALGGVFSGVHQGAKTGLGYNQPMTFQALMRAGASGAAIPSGPIYSSQGGGRSSWNSWLRGAMQGQVGYAPKTMDYDYIFSVTNPVVNSGGGPR